LKFAPIKLFLAGEKMAVEVFMPKMSDHMEAAEIVEWLVQEGSAVEKGQPILAIMTDKATVDLEAPGSGILKGIRAGVIAGAVVPVGETVAFVAAATENVPALPPLGASKIEPPAPSAPERLPTAPAAQAPRAEPGQIRAAPVVRRLARDLGIDLALVQGTGPEGRITEQDVRQYSESLKTPSRQEPEPLAVSPIARRMAQDMGVDLSRVQGTGPRGQITKEDVSRFAAASPAPAQQPSVPAPSGDDRWLELNPIQRLTGQRMLESVSSAPHFALSVDVDMTNALQLRETWMSRVEQETGERLSVTGVLVKIVAATLQAFPRANVSYQDGRIKLHQAINIGVAIGTNDGLVVPVIRDANTKTLVQITRELKIYQDKAQSMRFQPGDLADGTFTISNLGMYGVDRFNAIINPTQSAILAVGRIVKTPVGMPDDTIALRPMMNCTLSVDHRSLDGVQGANFLALLKERLTHPYLLLE
jgi:pyruvate dehydrogenase E2 component (dihydrolipoamide acetyltransferase)